ncbi:MAG: hypothetical protein WC340_15895 [Kiritimatiellia bacterium]
MKATCPHCGTYGPVEIFLADADAKSATTLVDALPGELPRLVWSYLGLFRKPGSPRVMTWSRVLRIVTELDGYIREPRTQWKGGRVVDNRPEFWADAIKTVMERDASGKFKRPLDGHNYLHAIAYELAELGFEGQVKKKEEALRYAPTDGRTVCSEDEKRRMDEQALEANRQRMVQNMTKIKDKFARKG